MKYGTNMTGMNMTKTTTKIIMRVIIMTIMVFMIITTTAITMSMAFIWIRRGRRAIIKLLREIEIYCTV